MIEQFRKFDGEPHGRDPRRNEYIGTIATEVAQLAHQRGHSIERCVGAFINEFAGCAYRVATERAVQPSVN
jgi:hypothetical protein